MARAAVLVAVVVLMQCCNVIVAARPLLEAPAVVGADGAGGWLRLIMQVLNGPGDANGNWQGSGHP
ncbi:hypothetical protein BS78_01G471200 [Paspalum vaginatum]|nr:hypothetical protein BS78_01G471200 [Paspalum vaginatum]